MDERRNDTELRLIQNDVTHLTKRFEEGQVRSSEWRTLIGKQISKLDEKLDGIDAAVKLLPCPQRSEQTKGIMVQMKALWVLTGGMLVAIIAEWIKVK